MLPKLLTTTDPQNYAQYLSEKTTQIANDFVQAGLQVPKPQIFESKPEYYRMRAEFAVYFTDHEHHFNYVMFVPGSVPRQKIELTEFPIAVKPINLAMRLLREYAPSYDYLMHKLFNINFLANQAGQVIIALEYHKHLDPAQWHAQAHSLKAELAEHGLDAQLLARAHKQELLEESKTLLETLELEDRSFKLYQVEGCFTQPNMGICQQMVNYVRQACIPQHTSDLLELYCGSGTFTVCLADRFRKVLATEISRVPTQTALKNLKANAIDNTRLVRLSAVEVTEALEGQRSFRRLQEAKVNLAEYQLDTLLIDPPRSGLQDPQALAFTARFKKVIYVSCNPASLIADLKVLSKTHRLERLAFFDQFPYTPHVESIVILSKLN
ncbi:MAG: tRNA (uridine(54)-C5)-methyltransferase TrmA [Succinivibrio sp.]|nr:tRNA (uridine(54)-C5)-methyltransferase TrmA [Succinivibrio sp.]